MKVLQGGCRREKCNYSYAKKVEREFHTGRILGESDGGATIISRLHACAAGANIPMSTPSRFAASASTHLTSARKFSSVGLSAFAL